ncbi:MAG: hypothetical protein ABSB88_25755 [Bryobacteraceae bacterium]|jgi:DNA-binding beta-propeller fold protein YncE
MAKRIWHIFTLAAMLAFAAQAQPADCNASAASPSVTIALPSHPFAVVPTQDGCWVFVSLTGPAAGIAVLKRGAGAIELSRVVPLASAPTGIALTHDGKLLIAAASDAVVFLDVHGLTSGATDAVLGSFSDGPRAESIYVNVTADDKLLFVSEEALASITVIDLERARANGYKADAIKGKIPTGDAPIALTFSPDGKWLYTTSQLALPEWNWPRACKPEGGPGGQALVNPEGAVIVVNVARAGTDPAQSVAARIPAGCSPVRMAISPKGDRIYVTARNSNAVVAFETAKLLTDGEHARLGMAPVGSAPVPIAVVDGGRKVVAGNSNRFAGTTSGESLVVLDATKIQGDADAAMGKVAAGAFPREMSVSADGHTLFLTNFSSNSLQVMSVDHLLDAPKPAETPKTVAGGAPRDASYSAAAAADMAAAAADTANTSAASAYATQAAAGGAQGKTRREASAAASTADKAAAAAETAAAAVESDASKATAASAAGDKAAANAAQAQAVADYSALQAADAQLAKAATDLATAASANVAFFGGATSGAGAINDIGVQDASAAANLLSAVTKGETAGYTAAAANEAAAVKDANTIADAAPPRAPAFQAAATAETAAQAAATAAAAGGSASAAAAAVFAAATAGATADGDGNPFAGAVETAAAAVADAVSATIAAQQAVNRLKTLK